MEPAPLDELVARLTARELDLLRALNAYQRVADIALQLGISKETVRTHLKNIRRKVDGRDPLALAAALACREGRNPYPVTPDRAIPSERDPANTSLERVPLGWADWLPVRQKGRLGNDLTVYQRCIWIGILAFAFAAGFGMLAAAVEVVSRLVATVA